MKRLVIAVDCDDVLVSTTPFFINAYNKAHGTTIQLSQATEDSFAIWQADRGLIESRLAALMDTDEYRLLRPTRDAAVVLAELAKYHELHVITARQESERELTQKMLDEHLPGIFTSLELVGFTGSKGDVCRRLGADILIDDTVRHLADAIAKGLPEAGAICFGNYAWTNSVVIDGIHYCHTWGDVQKVIDERAAE